MKLQGNLVPVAELTSVQRAAMLALMKRTYEGITEATFVADLAEKQWVIVLEELSSGQLCGFSTQMLLPLRVDDCPVTVLFSGDTVVAQEHWGDAALSHVWGNLALTLIDRHPVGTLFWALISKGYKTYRFLPVFFHEFYPRHDVATPAWAQALIEAFGHHKFPQAFEAGIIHAHPGKDRLRAGIADVTPARLRDPHVAFFANRNPGHTTGDELCCVAPLTRDNFTDAAYRVIHAKPVVARVPA